MRNLTIILRATEHNGNDKEVTLDCYSIQISLLCATIITTSRKYSLFADKSFELKHKKFFKELLVLMWTKKASLKNVYDHIELYAKEKIFDPKDVEAFRNR